jgi:hypothetical protein
LAQHSVGTGSYPEGILWLTDLTDLHFHRMITVVVQ